jgi:hypothetical protein
MTYYVRITYLRIPGVPGLRLHFVPWQPVTGAAADEYNLNVVDCNASVTVARWSSFQSCAAKFVIFTCWAFSHPAPRCMSHRCTIPGTHCARQAPGTAAKRWLKRLSSFSVCVECLFLTTPSRAPYRTPSPCAKRATYSDPPPVSATQNPLLPRRPQAIPSP